MIEVTLYNKDIKYCLHGLRFSYVMAILNLSGNFAKNQDIRGYNMRRCRQAIQIGEFMGKKLGNLFWQDTTLVKTNEALFRDWLEVEAQDFIEYHLEDLEADFKAQLEVELKTMIQPAIEQIVINAKSFVRNTHKFSITADWEKVLLS